MKGKIHKAKKEPMGWIVDLCTNVISNSQVTDDWKKVTCKKCLKLKPRSNP